MRCRLYRLNIEISLGESVIRDKFTFWGRVNGLRRIKINGQLSPSKDIKQSLDAQDIQFSDDQIANFAVPNLDLSELGKLSPRESQCLYLTACGWQQDKIGKRLGISVSTVRQAIRGARVKMNAGSSTEAAIARAIWLAHLQENSSET